MLAALPRNNGIYVFSTTGGHRPIGNFGRIKDKLVDKSGVADWTYHDFRRTLATELEVRGASRHDLMCLLNHTDNTVTGIYDRSNHQQQKLKFLSLWAQLTIKDQ